MMNTFTHGRSSSPKAERLAAAAATLRTMFASRRAPDSAAPQPVRRPVTINGATGALEPETNSAPHPVQGPDWLRYVPADIRGLVASHLPAGMDGYLGQFGDYTLPGSAPFSPSPIPTQANLPEGAQFLSRTYNGEAGSRPYKLYVPGGYTGQPVALVVMLHGCTQSPDDFAAGTGMNAAAEEQVFLVAYPGQTSAANPQKCWKWFSATDQQRGAGEPSLIAGITRQIMQEYAVDPQRVYVAGLSAGGAAAAIMGQTYPDLYAAVGVHSGLACGAASDLPSALAAMRGSGNGSPPRSAGSRANRQVPTIIFHGDRDATVHASNGDAVVGQALGDLKTRAEVQTGRVPGGHPYSRTVHVDQTGQPATEQWLIHGAGHAWSGGAAAGSYTDPRGPDATREMLRFFWEHKHPTASL